MSKQIDIAGNFHYYNRKENSVSSSRAMYHGGPIMEYETEVLMNLAEAIRQRDSLIQAVKDMRELLFSEAIEDYLGVEE